MEKKRNGGRKWGGANLNETHEWRKAQKKETKQKRKEEREKARGGITWHFALA